MPNDYANFAAAVLRGIRAPITPGNIAGFIGWSQAEGPLGSGSWQGFNPLNTTQNAPGARTINSAGVKRYANAQTGVNATVQTLLNGNYGGILNAFRQNNPHALGGAVGASPWGTSGQLASQTISQALTKNWGAPGVASRPGGGLPPSSSGAPTLGASFSPPKTQFDQAAYERARRAAIAGQFLASSRNAVSMWQQGPKSKAPAGASLFGPGMLTTTMPNRSDYETTSAAQTVLQKLAGATTLDMHPSAAGGSYPAGVATFEGKPVAKWIVPILQYAKQHGWTGTVNSGYRSFAQQKAIYDSGVRPAAVPGTSNHEGDAFPRGAVDVSDAQQLSAILRKSPYASVLIWAGGKDPVHFSHPHDGGY